MMTRQWYAKTFTLLEMGRLCGTRRERMVEMCSCQCNTYIIVCAINNHQMDNTEGTSKKINSLTKNPILWRFCRNLLTKNELSAEISRTRARVLRDSEKMTGIPSLPSRLVRKSTPANSARMVRIEGCACGVSSVMHQSSRLFGIRRSLNPSLSPLRFKHWILLIMESAKPTRTRSESNPCKENDSSMVDVNGGEYLLFRQFVSRSRWGKREKSIRGRTGYIGHPEVSHYCRCRLHSPSSTNTVDSCVVIPSLFPDHNHRIQVWDTGLHEREFFYSSMNPCRAIILVTEYRKSKIE